MVPRAHLACLGALPRGLQAELAALKARVGAFLTATYGPALLVERMQGDGRAAHAHLHALPWHAGVLERLAHGALLAPLRGPAGLRRWYERRGEYLYLEQGQQCGRVPLAALAGATWPVWLTAQTGAPPTADPAEAAPPSVRERWLRFEQTHGHPTTRIVACFLEHHGRLCLLKRSEAVGSARGRWHVVSGYLPDGKDALEHAYDELSEETGLARQALTLRRHVGPLMFADRSGRRPWEVDVYLFAAASCAVQLNWEHDDHAWVAPAALADYDCLPWLHTLWRALSGT